MNTVEWKQGATSSPDVQYGRDAAQKSKILTKIIFEFPHPNRKGQVDWKRAFKMHPDWKRQLGIAGEDLTPAYKLCLKLFGGNHSCRQLLHQITVGNYYVRLYLNEGEDSFWLDWRLPVDGSRSGDVGSKTYTNESECLASLRFCEKELKQFDPDAVQIRAITTLR